MKTRVLVIGGYGNFGQFIARRLAQETDIQVIVAGRSLQKAQQAARTLSQRHPVEAAQVDINHQFPQALQTIAPAIVIHTSGPFQSQSFQVVNACIDYGCHYIDLADAREFVTQIHQLDIRARAKSCVVCCGASSVPTLTSAIIDHYLPAFSRLDSVEYAISTAQKTSRGLATTAAVLSYAGKPFTTKINGKTQAIYGWLDLRRKKFQRLGYRFLGNCDIPDLALFPQRYPSLKTLRFQAGLELSLVHLVLFGLSWLVRLHWLHSLQPLAPAMLRISRLLDWAGSDNSGFYLEMHGADPAGVLQTLRFDLWAQQGDGMYIPCVPSILMALKLARGQLNQTGAFPCMGCVSLDEYMTLLNEFAIETKVAVAK